MSKGVQIYRLLLTGHFIKERFGNKRSYCIYDAKMNPLLLISRAMWTRLKEVIKQDRKQRITLNLSLVRQMHGNELLKKEYKSHLKNKRNAIQN